MVFFDAPKLRAASKRALALACGVLVFALANPAHAEHLDTTPPSVASSFPPDYPPEKLRAGEEARVVLSVSLDAQGKVLKVQVQESGGAEFDDAAMAAVRKWSFHPAIENGKAIDCVVTIPIRFRIPKSAPPAAPPATSPALSAVDGGAPSLDGGDGGAPLSDGGAPSVTSQTNSQTPAQTSQTNSQTNSLSNSQTPAQTPVAPAAINTDAELDAAQTGTRQYGSTVTGRNLQPSRGNTDFQVEIGELKAVPRANAADFLKLAPGILLTNEGGEAHAEQIFLRGFDAREGQDIDFTVDGVPINESGNLHGNGYADTHFIIPELVSSLRVIEGPYDPRQGNYGVAGSAEFELGLADRGLTAKYTVGSYNTNRALLLWGPKGESEHTFFGVDLYQTDGYGQNRQARHATAMGQYEGRIGVSTYRIAFNAFIASANSAGLIRQDDYLAGRKGFYDTYDFNQGEDVSRYSLSAELVSRFPTMTIRNQVFGVIRPFEVRENFTGFLLDTQQPQQLPHPQQGDLIDLANMAYTVGAKGSGKIGGEFLKQRQELEVGYFARGDFGTSLQQRIAAANNAPYHTDTDLDWKLGNVGLYADANLRATSWLALRGGVRGDLFSYDVNNLCAVQSAPDFPVPVNPPNSSCLTQSENGVYREPNQHSTSIGIAYQPRASLVIGPIAGLTASLSYGQGARSIDPVYITGDNHQEPFASASSIDAGLNFKHDWNGLKLLASSTFFRTTVSQDLVFSESAGRNVLGGPSTRLGSANAIRLNGHIFDISANATYAYATFDATSSTPEELIPYVPNLVLRLDASLFGNIPKLRLMDRAFYAQLSMGVTYVGPRPLPENQTGDSIFTVDVNARVRWWIFEIGITATNLLDSKYKLGVYNYLSDFHSQGTFATLVPSQMFSAGPPLQILGTLAVNLGGGR